MRVMITTALALVLVASRLQAAEGWWGPYGDKSWPDRGDVLNGHEVLSGAGWGGERRGSESYAPSYGHPYYAAGEVPPPYGPYVPSGDPVAPNVYGAYPGQAQGVVPTAPSPNNTRGSTQ